MSRDVRLQPHADPALRAAFFNACRAAGHAINSYGEALHNASAAAVAAKPLLNPDGTASASLAGQDDD